MTRRDTDPREAPPAQHGEDPGSPLQRWSRRKQEAAREGGDADSVHPPAEPAAGQEPSPGRHGEAPGQPPPEAELPPVESIDESSDVSAFLRPDVDEALQRVALRRLFHSAKFNVTDGLDVYAENYRKFEALGDIVTADMRYHAERLAKAAEKLAAGDDAEDDSSGDAAENAGDGPRADSDGDAQA